MNPVTRDIFLAFQEALLAHRQRTVKGEFTNMYFPGIIAAYMAVKPYLSKDLSNKPFDYFLDEYLL